MFALHIGPVWCITCFYVACTGRTLRLLVDALVFFSLIYVYKNGLQNLRPANCMFFFFFNQAILMCVHETLPYSASAYFSLRRARSFKIPLAHSPATAPGLCEPIFHFRTQRRSRKLKYQPG